MVVLLFCFLMIRRPPRSTLDRSSAASDVYKRQIPGSSIKKSILGIIAGLNVIFWGNRSMKYRVFWAVSYTHLRAHETVLDLVCRLLLEQKKKTITTKTPLFKHDKQKHTNLQIHTRRATYTTYIKLLH